MIKNVSIKNFGTVKSVEFSGLGNINLVIGVNQSGKTTLLKALYCSVKTVEQCKRGREFRSPHEILGEKLYWTFQTTQLGNLVRKGEDSLQCLVESDLGERFSFSFGPSTTKYPAVRDNTFGPRDSNSIFLPAKEILSLREIIMDSRTRYQEFGFDDTYLDLAQALAPTTRGRNYVAFSAARSELIGMLGGRLDYDRDKKDWFFKTDDRRVYEISLTSEGVKKLAILELLLGNRYLDPDSIVFIDEVEANLHPMLVGRFMETIMGLAAAGVQFFLATHSYFVVKKLYILAQRNKYSLPVFSFDRGECEIGNLKDGMPKNAIIDESVNLYKEEVSL